MHKEGHIGAALLVYAPISFVGGLIGGTEAAMLGGLIAAGLASVPDIDMRVPFVAHRGPTHTLWFAAVVGLLVGLIGLVVGLAQGVLFGLGLFVFAAVVGALSILSHLAADALTPMGIRPFKPWSEEHYTYDLVKAANPIANYALLGLGAVAAVVAGAAGAWINALF